MKGLYWRPQKVSRTAMALVGVLAVLGFLAVEELPVEKRSPRYEEKVRAARLAARAMDLVKDERIARGFAIDPEIDPLETGLVGTLSSPITSMSGNLYSKQLSTDPNFAAVVVELLDQAGVKAGDVVAVGTSSSFPALNVSTYAALTALGAEPIVITSASSSEWGANLIGFGWPDMEDLLVERGVFDIRATAGSIGGVEDRGVGMSRAGVTMLRGMLDRHGIRLIEHEDVAGSVQERLHIYEQEADGRRIAAYVNVGGGYASIGGSEARQWFRPGVNFPSAWRNRSVDSVMARFLDQGVPVIHLTSLHSLAQTWGIPPVEPGMQRTVGEGRVFVSVTYNHWLAFGVLVVLVLALYATTRSDLGARLLDSGSGSGKNDRPQPMV